MKFKTKRSTICAIPLYEECFQIELKHKFILLMNAKELVDYVWWRHVRIIQVNITCPTFRSTKEPIFIIAHYQSVSENKILTTTHLIRKQVTQIAVTVPT